MWPVCPLDEVSSSAWINILHKCYTAFTVILFFSMSLPGPLFYVFEDYTLEDAIEMMSILLTQLRSGMKMMTFIVYKKEIQELINALYENFYIHGRNLTAEESSIIRQAIKHARRITIGYFVLIFLLIWSMILHPITFNSTDQVESADANHTATLPRLPFKTWYPKWDPTKRPQFEIEYAAQAILTVLEASSVGSIDPFCATLMIYVASQFQLLSISLNNIKKNALLKSGPGIYRKSAEGSYPKRVSTLDKNSLLPVMPEHTGNNIQRNVSDNWCMDNLDLNNLQGINVSLKSDEGKQILSMTESYGQTERETIIYIKKCIKHHQSLLT
ncbi:hypothetical protein B7P43_G06759 [Cryptotermes secundus]|uniref:Odorant receptor n=1 Tax=Cryptotermes secundus TaxID=105785 RepID=A0A2J7RIB2_9NEOP|nr:hypothetical protein B7P43_G06759 [Cryptotermes secundus]